MFIERYYKIFCSCKWIRLTLGTIFGQTKLRMQSAWTNLVPRACSFPSREKNLRKDPGNELGFGIKALNLIGKRNQKDWFARNTTSFPPCQAEWLVWFLHFCHSQSNVQYCSCHETELESLLIEYQKRTSTISPLPVSIVVVCYGAPWALVVFRYTTVVSTSFVSEREGTAVTRCRSLLALAYKEKKSCDVNWSHAKSLHVASRTSSCHDMPRPVKSSHTS